MALAELVAIVAVSLKHHPRRQKSQSQEIRLQREEEAYRCHYSRTEDTAAEPDSSLSTPLNKRWSRDLL